MKTSENQRSIRDPLQLYRFFQTPPWLRPHLQAAECLPSRRPATSFHGSQPSSEVGRRSNPPGTCQREIFDSRKAKAAKANARSRKQWKSPALPHVCFDWLEILRVGNNVIGIPFKDDRNWNRSFSLSLQNFCPPPTTTPFVPGVGVRNQEFRRLLLQVPQPRDVLAGDFWWHRLLEIGELQVEKLVGFPLDYTSSLLGNSEIMNELWWDVHLHVLPHGFDSFIFGALSTCQKNVLGIGWRTTMMLHAQTLTALSSLKKSNEPMASIQSPGFCRIKTFVQQKLPQP